MNDFDYFPDSLIIIDIKIRLIVCFFKPVELFISKTKLSMKRHLIAQIHFRHVDMSLLQHFFIHIYKFVFKKIQMSSNWCTNLFPGWKLCMFRNISHASMNNGKYRLLKLLEVKYKHFFCYLLEILNSVESILNWNI
jgi:hypothetical protein